MNKKNEQERLSRLYRTISDLGNKIYHRTSNKDSYILTTQERCSLLEQEALSSKELNDKESCYSGTFADEANPCQRSRCCKVRI